MICGTFVCRSLSRQTSLVCRRLAALLSAEQATAGARARSPSRAYVPVKQMMHETSFDATNAGLTSDEAVCSRSLVHQRYVFAQP